MLLLKERLIDLIHSLPLKWDTGKWTHFLGTGMHIFYVYWWTIKRKWLIQYSVQVVRPSRSMNEIIPAVSIFTCWLYPATHLVWWLLKGQMKCEDDELSGVSVFFLLSCPISFSPEVCVFHYNYSSVMQTHAESGMGKVASGICTNSLAKQLLQKRS